MSLPSFLLPPPQSRKAPGATIEESLATVLEESAAQKTDKLESLFETSVMLFLRGDYRGAIEQLLRVQVGCGDGMLGGHFCCEVWKRRPRAG